MGAVGRRRAVPICIAGMHRSGASLLAQQLALCGVFLGDGDELPKPGPDCPRGSWENRHFRSLNDELLARLGGGWDYPPADPTCWESVPHIEDLRDRAVALVQRFGHHRVWGWKDPRNSLTLPFWRKVVPGAKVVICLRNPVEVARSLHKRGASSDAFAFHLWLTYYQRLLSAVPPGDRVVTHFDAHFLDPRAELQRVLGLLGLRTTVADLEDAVARFAPSLRHEWAGTADLLAAQAPADVAECYADLCAEAGPACARALADRTPLPHVGERWELSSTSGTGAGYPARTVKATEGSLPGVRELLDSGWRTVRRRGLVGVLRVARARFAHLARQRIHRLSIGRPSGLCALSEFGGLATKYDVIVFPYKKQQARRGRIGHLAGALAQAGHRVFVIRAAPGRRGMASQRVLQPNLFELAIPDGDPSDEVLRHIASLRHEAGIAAAACLVEDPAWSSVALSLRQRFGCRLVCDYAAAVPALPDSPKGSEILSSSDLVLAASEALLADASARNNRCILLPHAADFQRFRFPSHAVPEQVEHLQRPVLACFGLECEAFDAELVHNLAQARPGWTLVCIGPAADSHLSSLPGLANVHIVDMGACNLAQIAHASNVCLVPVKDGIGCEAGTHLWILDLLSTGRPVVTSRLPELGQYGGLVELAPDLQGWLAAIEAALGRGALSQAADALAFVRENTWRERALRLEQAVQSAFPLASIIVVSYNNLDYTRLCLDSIYKNTVYPNMEVLVIDNASSDGSREYLQGYAAQRPSLRLIVSDANEGFAAASNRGLHAAEGDYLVLLNNDTVVTRGWLSRLILHLQDTRVGLVGPVTNWAANQSRIPVTYRNLEDMDAFADEYTAAHMDQHFDIPMLLFFCVAMRRSVYDEVGQLDERFGMGLCEDRDYAHRTKQAGYRVVCAEDVFIHHFGKASFSKLGKGEYGRLFERNRRLYEEKWSIPWEGHGRPA